ncbi:MAG: glutathione S-transferase family protein [Deltaproteobacteria bacterium]|nr:glutathione S-transferase family protein [Deltaproteobacteria bacterium]
MITLYQFPTAWGLPNLSPFCMKVETYLRMVELPYRVVAGLEMRKAPKGKMPYIEDAGRLVADSGFILEYLKERYGDPLDGALSREAWAKGHAVRRLLEEHFYFVAVHQRWIADAGWALVKEAFFSSLPAYLRVVGAPIVRRKMRSMLHAQGVGRHSVPELLHLGKLDLDALAATLGDSEFLLGAAPSSVDATVFAFLANVLWSPVPTELKDHARTHANLVAYTHRMRERYFPEMEAGRAE